MQFDNVPVRVALRPPRAVIIFDGGEHWHYWARMALHCATRMWGGQGFVVIPHHNGEVRSGLLPLIRAYDPDYVVALEKTFADLDQIEPGSIPLPEEETERQQYLEMIGDQSLPDAAGEIARKVVTNICWSHRRRDRDGGWDDDVRYISASNSWQRFTAVEDATSSPDWGEVHISAPGDWGGALGVAFAARCGASRRPVAGAEPELDEDQTRQLWNWLLGNDYRKVDRLAPIVQEMATWDYEKISAASSDTEFPLVFSKTLNGLVQVGKSGIIRRTANLVLGDTADDFALAHIAERLYGGSVWMPRAVWDQESVRAGFHHLHVLISKLARERNALSISSLSESDESLEGMAEYLRNSALNAMVPERQQDLAQRHNDAINVRPVIADPDSAMRWAVAEQFDIEFPVGVHRSDRDSIEMIAGQRYPDIAHPALVGCDALQWQVDVSFVPHTVPAGRGVDGHDLLASDEHRYLTWVRSGRDGISFESRRWDFIQAGWSRASKLANPRLRRPSLATWADLAAKSFGMSMAYSTAGSRFMSLARLWGSSEAVASTMAGPMLKALKAFNTPAKMSITGYPDGEGVVLASGGSTSQPKEGFLRFKGIAKFHGGEPEALRDEVDALLTLGILIRGLVLGCEHCRRVAFIPVGRLAQVNRCVRCDGSNPLTASSWNRDGIEPTWFYDLHPIVRDFLNENGEVPVLLSHHLRQKSSTYTDAPEMELLQGEKPIAEADLIALSDRRVLVAEAKSSNNLGSKSGARREAARKRVQLANTLQADEIVLATSREAWEASSLDAIKDAVGDMTPAWTAPRIRIITALGTEEVQDEYLT
ncbi:hypothetical protein [Glycomyces sp. NPDC048151]|uniref:hypothetical protein n=1 Tax=Glycomyces sp. NPDC048151 TaxID=3364002 RepID=UPI0037150126